MVNMKGHAKKVHRSLLQRDLMFGVPTAGLVLVVILFMMTVYFFGWVFMIVPIAALYVLMRFFTSKDPWMIDMLIDFISQKDVFIP